MTIEKLIELINNGNREPKCLYHFTDTRNIPNIVEHGLLSRTEIQHKRITNVVCGGNDWSFDQDDRRGVSDYVHLCFFNQHPMEFIARKDNRIVDSFFIKVLPEALNLDGVKFCAGVSNAADSEIFGIEDFEAKMDVEILFERTDWREQKIQDRLKIAEKYEILIPKSIPMNLLRK